jgi:hypothetical protein
VEFEPEWVTVWSRSLTLRVPDGIEPMSATSSQEPSGSVGPNSPLLAVSSTASAPSSQWTSMMPVSLV